MPSVWYCDAMLEQVEMDKLEQIGPLRRHYGPTGAELARAYLAEVNELHTKTAALFAEGLAQLRKAYRERLPAGGKLPDEA